MFDAYVKSAVATKLPLLVESATANGKTLLVVTAPKQQQNAFLLKYSPTDAASPTSTPYDLQTCRNFAKKTVTQLRLISELDILICLSDSIITVHDASPSQVNFQPIQTLTKTKGASIFAVELVKNETTEGRTTSSHGYSVSFSPVLAYLCVAVKRKLHLYCWRNREFQEITSLTDQTSFSDNVRSMVWCNSHVAVAVRDEYFMVTIFSDIKDNPPGNVRPVCMVGNRMPLMVALPDYDVVGLCRDDVTALATCDGNLAIKHGFTEIRWSECPQAIEYDRPYLLAVLKDSVEIRSLRPNQLVQTVHFSALKFLCRGGPRTLYAVCQPAANQTDLFHLHSDATLVRSNIQLLVNEKQYELALQLAESQYSDDNVNEVATSDEKVKRVEDIKRLYAYHLFTQRRFNEAFDLYKSINTEVIYVIGLFPDFIPPDLRRNMFYPGPLLNSANDLPKNDWMSGLQALTAYLSEMRTNIAKELYLQNQAKDYRQRRHEFVVGSYPSSALSPLSAADVTLKTLEELNRMKSLLQIVDTTLLKCYLQTNDMLVASLLRLPDNSCDAAESEAALIKYKKFSELLLLYERKQMHDEALKLLKSEAKRAGSPLKGIDRTVHYLQNLGNDQLGLIFEYASWVLKENPEEGLKIFTEDCDEVKHLDRLAVLEYLAKNAPYCVIPYLEHIILQWGEANPRFHDALVEQYVRRVKELLADYVHGLPEYYTVAAAGQEPNELGRYRKSLLTFLETSCLYTPELILVQLPKDSMFEERALIFGRLRRHEQAIAIYTNVLHDYKRAERYCRANYRRIPYPDSQVYLTLLRMYARPADNSIIGPMHAHLPKPQPNVSMALKVLKDYAAYIDTSQALELLAPTIPLKDVWSALESVLQSTAVRVRDLDVQRNLSYAHYLRTQQQRIRAESVKWSINYDSTCTKCSKKIGSSAFARFPDGSLVHYYCYKGASSVVGSVESLSVVLP